MSRAVIVRSEFDPAPSLARSAAVRVAVAEAAGDGQVLGVPVGIDGEPPAIFGLDRQTLARTGFDGRVGQTLAVPGADG